MKDHRHQARQSLEPIGAPEFDQPDFVQRWGNAAMQDLVRGGTAIAPDMGGALEACFGPGVSGIQFDVGSPSEAEAVGGEAFTTGTRVNLGGMRVTASDLDAVEVLGHETAHALAGGGSGEDRLSRGDDPGEVRATSAGAAFRTFVETGMQGTPPRLRPATGGRAEIHRSDGEERDEWVTPLAPAPWSMVEEHGDPTGPPDIRLPETMGVCPKGYTDEQLRTFSERQERDRQVMRASTAEEVEEDRYEERVRLGLIRNPTDMWGDHTNTPGAPALHGQELPELALEAAAGAVLPVALPRPLTAARTAVVPAEVAVAESGANNAANYLRLKRQLASEAQMAELLSGEGKVMAGAGGRKPIEDLPRLLDQYGGQASDWQKVASSNYKPKPAGGPTIVPSPDGGWRSLPPKEWPNGSGVRAPGSETHLYRNSSTGELYEFKTKLDEDYLPPGPKAAEPAP